MSVDTMTEIYLGRLVKAFGIRGEIKFHPSEDFWEGVLASERLSLRCQGDDDVVTLPLTLERSRPHKNSYVLKITGVDDRSDAEALIGGEVFVPEEDLDVDFPDEVLPFQVVGMRVKDEGGRDLGEVISVMRSAAHDIYEVGGGGQTFLVPAVPEFVVSLDWDDDEIVIRPLPGLIEEEG